MDKGSANTPRISRRQKEETTYSEGGENDTEEEGHDTSGTFTRSQHKLLDVIKLIMEQQIKQLQQQTLQWKPMICGRKRATRTSAEGERMAGGMVEERERLMGDALEIRAGINE